MSRFYVEVKGNRGMASRQGTKESGIWCHIRGWNLGIDINGFVDEEGNDSFVISKTGGSRDNSSELIMVLKKENKE